MFQDRDIIPRDFLQLGLVAWLVLWQPGGHRNPPERLVVVSVALGGWRHGDSGLLGGVSHNFARTITADDIVHLFQEHAVLALDFCASF